ncbi:hypothetical protein PanWU01x14_063630 [Parasponia andersonii]|uniref:Uncharacterized protein n=1 Tax=Parasponia andersonii TaxID=3476 RepID=A0A2P5DH23_PARAD|nr:hypothetical protein PanWU01x14_063630 [Parasponia andersonii]
MSEKEPLLPFYPPHSGLPPLPPLKGPPTTIIAAALSQSLSSPLTPKCIEISPIRTPNHVVDDTYEVLSKDK